MNTNSAYPSQHRPLKDDEVQEPDRAPVGPDEGPLPTHIPQDPEHDRVLDPEE